MQLPGHQHRVDDCAEVVDAGVAHDLDHAGVGIDLDFRDVAAIGEGRGHFLRGVVDVERGRHAVRLFSFAQPPRQLDDVDAAVGAGDGKAAVRKFDVTL